MTGRAPPAAPQSAHGPLRSFGRTRSRTLKPRQASLLDTLLPKLAVDLASPLGRDALGEGEAWLEIGFGGGEHLAEQAARRPDVRHLGAEPFLNGAASALRHLEARALTNVRLHVGDARDLLAALPDGRLRRVFLLFPDPWPKARHHKRRLVQPAFAAELARVTAPGSRLRFATDWADYADQALAVLRAEPTLAWTARRADDWRTPPADHVTTRYEEKRLGDCAPVFLEFMRR